MRCRHGDMVKDQPAKIDLRFRLRAEVLAAMAAAKDGLDQLGDEQLAAATLQHAIDRLSYRDAGAAADAITNFEVPT